MIHYVSMAKANPKNTPFEKFTRAVDALMRVPHSEIQKALEQEKREKAERKLAKQQQRASASDRAFDSED
jgi:hypothetical protein